MGTGKQLISVGVLAVVAAGAAWAAPEPVGLSNPFADTVSDEPTRGPVSPTPGSGDPQGQTPPGGPDGGTPAVPLPSAALLGAAGLGVLGGIYRRRTAR